MLQAVADFCETYFLPDRKGKTGGEMIWALSLLTGVSFLPIFVAL
jgi:hypothetical protein